MTPIEIKSYFDSNQPPETFDFKPWAKITDCEKFLQSTYNTLANCNGNYEDCPAYWRLKEFYLDILKVCKYVALNVQLSQKFLKNLIWLSHLYI